MLNIKSIFKVVVCLSLCWSSVYENAVYAAYSFDKIRFFLSNKHPIDTIRFDNPDADIPISLQMKVLRWTQVNGNDQYQSTNDLIVAPPQFKIAPKKFQLVRVGWRKPAPITQELAYRLVTTDLTLYKKKANVVTFKVQVNMPVYIEPDNVITQANWQIKRMGDKLNILLTNTGNVHLNVSKLTLTNANNEVIASQPTSFVLLPGQSKQGAIAVNKLSGQTVNAIASTDFGEVKATVNVS